MKITEICCLLRNELYQNGYEYGFYLDGKKYKPDMSNGFDNEYYNLSITIYRIQDPIDTMREKIGTCIDTVVVMKTILDSISVSCKILLLRNESKNRLHTILTFEAEDKIVYLELTPQSSKPWYGREIIYNSEKELINEFNKNGYSIFDVTNKVIIGAFPEFLL